MGADAPPAVFTSPRNKISARGREDSGTPGRWGSPRAGSADLASPSSRPSTHRMTNTVIETSPRPPSPRPLPASLQKGTMDSRHKDPLSKVVPRLNLKDTGAKVNMDVVSGAPHPSRSPRSMSPRQRSPREAVPRLDLCASPRPRSPTASSPREKSIPLSMVKELLGTDLRQLLREELFGEEMRLMLREELDGASTHKGVDLESRGGDPDEPPLFDDFDRDDPDASRNATPSTSKQKLQEMRKKMTRRDDTAMHLAQMNQLKGSNNIQAWVAAAANMNDTTETGWQKLVRFLEGFGATEAPYGETLLKKFIDSWVFQFVTNFAIFLNIAYEIYAVDFRLAQLGSGKPADDPSFSLQVDSAFIVVYAIEFVCRIYYFRWYYFVNSAWKFNTLDLILLVLSAWTVLGSLGSDASGGSNIGWLRIVRTLKMVRLVRILKLTATFKTLGALLQSISETMLATCWSMVMLFSIYLVCGLMICSRVANSVTGYTDLDPEFLVNLQAAFGSVGQGTVSFVMATTGGNDWSFYYELLGEATDSWNQVFFLVSILFISIALMNLILGLFVDRAMKSLESDDQDKALEKSSEYIKTKNHLIELCAEQGMDRSDMSPSQWKEFIRTPAMVQCILAMGFNCLQLDLLIDMLSDGDESHEVTVDDFVSSFLHMQGSASSLDLHVVLFSVLEVKHRMSQQADAIAALASRRDGREGLSSRRM